MIRIGVDFGGTKIEAAALDDAGRFAARIRAPNPGRYHESLDAIRRLVGAILLEQNDEWAVQRGRYMTLETMAGLSDDPIVKLPAVAT